LFERLNVKQNLEKIDAVPGFHPKENSPDYTLRISHSPFKNSLFGNPLFPY